MSRTQVQLWYKRFKESWEDINDDARPSRPSKSTINENIEAVKKMILDNTGSAKYLFLKIFKKKTTKYFHKFLFLFEGTSHSFIQIATSVAYTIGLIFKHINCSCISPIASRILACRRNIYLWRHPTNNSSTVSNCSSEVAKQRQLCGW